MKVTVPSIADKEKITFEKDDVLNRKPFGEMLTNLVQGGEESLVMSIDAKWGEGKTTFVKMWQSLLNDNKIPNIRIDAFENDYVDDAFILLVNTILAYADEHKNRSDRVKEGMQTFVENAFLVSRRFAIWGAGVAVKGLTLNAIDAHEIERLKAIADDVANGVYGATQKALEGILRSHRESIEAVRDFKEALSNLPNVLAIANASGTDENEELVPPLVIIIDELDRCKPTFAVEIIERVKHLFSVKNVVFVLVMNKKQLEGSVKAVYGQSIDAHTYLQKFIKVETRLPKATILQNESSRSRVDGFNGYCEYLFETYGFDEEIKNESKIFLTQHLPDIARNGDLSLREIENVFINLATFYKTRDRHQKLQSELAVSLSVIKVKNPELLVAIANDDITYKAIDSVIGFSRHITDQHFGLRWHSGLIKFCLLTEDELADDKDEEFVLRRFSGQIEYSDYDQPGRRNQLRLCAQRLLWFSVE